MYVSIYHKFIRIFNNTMVCSCIYDIFFLCSLGLEGDCDNSPKQKEKIPVKRLRYEVDFIIIIFDTVGQTTKNLAK